MRFYHIDDFEEKYNFKKEYPVILKKEDQQISTFLNKTQLNKLKRIEDLIDKVEKLSL